MKKKTEERSFSLLETVMAIGFLATMVTEVIAVQGNAIYFSDYERRSTKAMWLAKGVMSQVEHEYYNRPFEDMDYKHNEKPFSDQPRKENDVEFTYKVSIEEWKLPLIDLVTGGGLGGGEEKEESDDGGGAAGGGDFLKSSVEAVLGDEILKIAHVEVFWPEGSIKESVSLTMLLTNERKLDEFIATQKNPGKKKSNKEEKEKNDEEKSKDE